MDTEKIKKLFEKLDILCKVGQCIPMDKLANGNIDDLVPSDIQNLETQIRLMNETANTMIEIGNEIRTSAAQGAVLVNFLKPIVEGRSDD